LKQLHRYGCLVGDALVALRGLVAHGLGGVPPQTQIIKCAMQGPIGLSDLARPYYAASRNKLVSRF